MAYSGYIYADIFHYSGWNTVPSTDFSIDGAERDLDKIVGSANVKVVKDNVGIAAPYYKWETSEPDKYNPNETRFYKYLAFENKVFHAKFEIGEPYGTASSCACGLIHPDFSCRIYLVDLWPLLRTITFDDTDPQNVKKFIEGDFTFVKKGQSVAIVGA
jgi:hypothetical protein